MTDGASAARPAAVAPTARSGRIAAHGAMLLFAWIIAGSFALGARAAPLIDPSALTTLRFAIAAGALGGAMVALGVLRRSRVGWPRMSWRHAALGGLLGAYFVCMFEALRLAPPTPLAAVFTTAPMITAIIALLALGRRTTPRVWTALAIGAAGALWVIFDGRWARFVAFDVGLGEAIFFAGSACHAAYAAFSGPWRRGEPLFGFVLGILIAALALVSLSGAGALVETDWTALPPLVWLVAAYLGVCATLITAACVQFAALRLPGSKVMAYTYLPPTLVILAEGVAGRGWPPLAIAPGVLLILGALAVLAVDVEG